MLLKYPQGTRMPPVAIYGDSGMGKTMIMKRFRDEHSPSFDPLTGVLKTPVLAMEMSGNPRSGSSQSSRRKFARVVAEPAPIPRSQLLGWRIRCPLSGNLLRHTSSREISSPFRQHHGAALRGKKLRDDEVERGHMMGDNRVRFTDAAESMIPQATLPAFVLIRKSSRFCTKV